MSSVGKSKLSQIEGRILVGCPVFERDWILDRWFDHLEGWPVELDFVFAFTPGGDRTLDIIQSRAPMAHIILAEEGDHSTERNWGQRSRVETLADMRNAIFGYVRAERPAFYFSLDSDVLVAPWEDSQRLFESLRLFDAISPLAYLGSGDIANAFHWRGDHVTRLDRKKRYGVPQTVDVLAAAILMTPAAYDYGSYGYDMLGEDIYWAKTLRNGPVKLGFDSSVVFRHVMSREKLHMNDVRIPWSS